MDKKGTVLLVEDYVMLLDKTRRLLEKNGYSVLIAETVADALSTLSNAAQPPDAAVLDIDLPDGDGLKDLLPVLRDKYKIPALFLTGDKRPATAAAGLSAGGFDYIRKPYGADEFVLRVDNMVKIAHERKYRSFSLEHGLTETEMTIARYIQQGDRVKEISFKVNLSETRIRDILTGIYRKLEITAPDGQKRSALSEILRKHGVNNL